MPHISKKKLSEQNLRDIKHQLLSLITHTDKQQANAESLLTPVEIVMLSKRLAIIAMLSKKVPWPLISKILEVSPSTIDRIHKQINVGYYMTIISYLNNKKESRDFWSTLEVILRAGMPPRGRGRWKFLDNL